MICDCGCKVYRNNKWKLCISCYRAKLYEYRRQPSRCRVCNIVLAMKNESGLCKKHRHAKYMNDYWRREHRVKYERLIRKQYKSKNRDVIAQKQAERERCDLLFKLRRRLRHRLYMALRSNARSGSAVELLGCSMEEFRRYLESKFLPGMTWDNYGKWHIDHIRPLSSFDLSKKEELTIACHYTNLQPLWAKDNISKGDKYDQGTA